MKKVLCGLGALAASVPAFAADGDPDFSGATTALTSVATALKDWAGSAMPILVGIAAAFMAFWLGKMVFRLVKSWTSSAK